MNTIISILGAIAGFVGAISGGMALWLQVRASVRRIKVEIYTGYTIGANRNNHQKMIFITGYNPGLLDVNISHFGLRIGKEGQMVFTPGALEGGEFDSDMVLPGTLKQGEKCSVWMKPQMIAKALINNGHEGEVTFRAFLKENIGKEYMSKKFRIDLSKFSVAD